jgi:hypothetical protein
MKTSGRAPLTVRAIVRRLLPLILVLLIPTATAQAKTFCVDMPACPEGGEPKESIKAAVDAAGGVAGKDRIEIGPGTYRGSDKTYISLGPDNPVDVVGAGRGKTIIEGWREIIPIVLIYNGESSVSDMSLRIASDYRNSVAIDSHGPNVIERVDIDAMVPRSSDMGMILRGGGTVRDVKVAIDPKPIPVNYGIYLTATSGKAPVDISDVEVSGGYGITADKGGVGPVSVRRARITASTYGMFFNAPGTATVEDAAVRMVEHDASTPGGNGLSARTDGGGPLTVDVRDSTFVTDNEQSRGLMIEMFGTTPVDLNARDVAISTTGSYAYDLLIHNLPQARFNGAAKISLEHSAWKRNSVFNGAQNGSIVRGAGNVDLEKSPLNLGADLKPLAGSVLIDNGTPGPLGQESPTDAFGLPRLVDGDGDGAARRDIGAAEAPAGTNPAPVAPAPQGDPDPPGVAKPPVTQNPQPADRAPSTKITQLPTRRRPTVRGRATDDRGVTRVEVSVTRRAGKRCLSLTATGSWKRAGRPKGGSCAPVFALRAKGTASWSLRLKGLRRGRIEIASRAVDSLGQIEAAPRLRAVKLG